MNIDFSRRIEILKSGNQYRFQECLKEKCNPLLPKSTLTVNEVKLINERKGSYGGATAQLFFDLSQNFEQSSNSKTKIVVGKILDNAEFKTALYYLKPTQEVRSEIVIRLNELKSKENPETYILLKVCDDPECRPFTGSNEEFNQALIEIKKAVR